MFFYGSGCGYGSGLESAYGAGHGSAYSTGPTAGPKTGLAPDRQRAGQRCIFLREASCTCRVARSPPAGKDPTTPTPQKESIHFSPHLCQRQSPDRATTCQGGFRFCSAKTTDGSKVLPKCKCVCKCVCVGSAGDVQQPERPQHNIKQ